MISNDDMKQIMEQMEYCFVPREECNKHCDKFQSELSGNAADHSVIKFQLKLILGILSAVGVAVLSLVITSMWG